MLFTCTVCSGDLFQNLTCKPHFPIRSLILKKRISCSPLVFLNTTSSPEYKVLVGIIMKLLYKQGGREREEGPCRNLLGALGILWNSLGGFRDPVNQGPGSPPIGLAFSMS